MSNRPKDMWKLLYSLLSRNEADLKKVFPFIDDILCKEPSLIRPYSVCSLNNSLQGTFILWLFNKFLDCLGEDTGPQNHMNNIQLQQRILTSCLINCPGLFERVVVAYVGAMDQLATKLSVLETFDERHEHDGDNINNMLSITSFFCNDTCFHNIDPNFSFAVIHVPLDGLNSRLYAIFAILNHALEIGYSVYPILFINSLQSILKGLKECDFDIKILCLHYCQVVFEKSHVFQWPLSYFFELTVTGVMHICRHFPIWLRDRYIHGEDVEKFLQILVTLLDTRTCFVEQLQCKSKLQQLCFQILINVVEIARNPHCAHIQTWPIYTKHFITFMLCLQVHNDNGFCISKEQAATLLYLTKDNPIVYRLLAINVIQRDMETSDFILKGLQKRLLDLLEKCERNCSDQEGLKELLLSLSFLEHQKCQQWQLITLQKTQCTSAVLQEEFPSHLNIFANIDDTDWPTSFNLIVKNFLCHAITTTESQPLMGHIFIVRMLLDIRGLRNALDTSLMQRIIAFIERPVKTLLCATHMSTTDNLDVSRLSLQALCNIFIEHPKEVYNTVKRSIINIADKLFATPTSSPAISELRKVFCANLSRIMFAGFLNTEQILSNFLTKESQNTDLIKLMLESVYCIGDADTCYAFMLSPYTTNGDDQTLDCKIVKIVCSKCSLKCGNVNKVIKHIHRYGSILLPAFKSRGEKYIPTISSTIKQLLCNALDKDDQLSFIGNHVELSSIVTDRIAQLLSNTEEVTAERLQNLQLLLPKLVSNNDELLKQAAKFMLEQTLKSLRTPNRKEQLQTLMLINCWSQGNLSERWLFHFFKMTFFFLIYPESTVMNEAILCAIEMCNKHGVQPSMLWNWYKRDALNVVIRLVVYAYLQKGIRLTRSLKAFTKMLGYSCAHEFICKYYRVLITMLLPYCVKHSQCKGLIVNISRITRKPISGLFVASFLRIYSHIYLTENAAIGNKCINLVVKCTACSLNKLMNTDVKQTVAEFLIYFNRNPNFVTQAFQCLLLHNDVASQRKNNSIAVQNTTVSDFAKFIADRFLGVITYFETCLAEPNFEKSLKAEALYSLGQIIRFVGAYHVTQFRFKIIAMLSFVVSLNDKDLQSICLKIWNIFLRIVNIQELGPSLSRIVASLQPLLSHSETEVNAIYEYVILENDSLLGSYIPDLYFMEGIENVAPAIRSCVARQTEFLKSDKTELLEKISFFFKQITNENLQVRIFGLKHLCSFIAAHRQSINRIVLSEIKINSLIENVVDILVAGCRHEDRNLQLASGKCLGELGAIDPSYLLFKNAPEQQTGDLPLSIHTDAFAIMALTELCRAYQFQKVAKFVDNFSLAIQETLSVCGVSPKENKKLNVWEAIPIRMRPVMEPLLTSCYTGSSRESKCKEHPIFGSSYCHSYEDWAFTWASRLIDYVQQEDTKHLLRSYKPSIKRDNNTLATFFPYILLHALQDCTEEQMEQIYDEFNTVFSFTSQKMGARPSYEAAGVKEFLSTNCPFDRSMELDRKGNSMDQCEQLEDNVTTCVKLCSEQIDFLKRWIREWQRVHIVGGGVRESSDACQRIENFVEKFDKLNIAMTNYNSGEFARALMYLEEYIEVDTKTRLQDQISFLIRTHGNLMDADSVEGAVYMKKSNLNLSEEVLVNRIVDRPQETMTCYEQLMSSGQQINQENIKGMVNCYLRMETPETALLVIDGLWQKLTDQYTDDYFKECKSEVLWRLGRYDELQQLLEDSVMRRKTIDWNVQCGEAFLLFGQNQNRHEYDFDNFVEKLDAIRNNVLCSMRTCTGVKMNSYRHLYDEVVKLHLLNVVEKNKKLLNNMCEYLTATSEFVYNKCLDEVRLFFSDLDTRLCVLQPTVRVMEPVLCFQRNLLIETKRLMAQHASAAAHSSSLCNQVNSLIDIEIGKLWIRSVQLNREAGSLQQAQISIMKAEQYAPQTLFIEKAQLMWKKGDHTNCFKLIEENLERFEMQCQGNVLQLESMDRVLYAEAKFLQATYSAESMNICSEQNLRYFKDAITCNRRSEKCHVQLAQYSEKIYDSFSTEEKESDMGLKLIVEIMLNYAKSLRCGFENVYQSLPRLLSYWLDFTSRSCSIRDAVARDASLATKAARFQDLSNKMNDLILNCSSKLPASIFYTAFSQLLSRICHPSDDVYNVLRTIVIKLVEHFPHQALWMLLPVFKSSYTNRVKRCKLIFTDKRLDKPQFQKLLTDFNMLAERLIELTNKDLALDRTYKLSVLLKQLPRLFADSNFSEILLPFEKYMQAPLPLAGSASPHLLMKSGGGSQEQMTISQNPFPYKEIYISRINESVTVLRSAAKPKKIIIECNDGKQYVIMVKPKDDLRKDFRLMEFNGLVKRYLHQDPQARHRCLRIRTYAAIPFNEECGLVEWLPQLNSFRSICNALYRTRGQGIPDRMLRTYAVPRTDPIATKRAMFVDRLLVAHPPVFQEWFRQRFVTPHTWYEARSSYVKTIAVMSMVGYILGLGDRHGENVLFDETSGEAVHVDFNCLFNQGECFAYPELVPFRLTHNMVFAMGPLGVEGMYRKCCEITLRVLKDEAKTLMSVLRPFVYDLVALNHNSRKQTTIELTDPKAMKNVRRIEERLQGYVKKTLANSMPLSIEGQVSFLINESTDIDNLAAMYIGWGSFL